MNMMILDGYKAKISYDPEIDLFRGEILGLNGSADFYGKSPSSLRREFRKSLQVFLEVCREKNISPAREFSGRFNLRIPSQLHCEVSARANSEGKSINRWVVDVLERAVGD